MIERVFSRGGIGQQKGALSEVVEHEPRQDDPEPSCLDGNASEVAHVGIESLAARHGQEYGGENGQTRRHPAMGDVAQRVSRVDGREHLEEASRGGRLPIYTTWHDRVFLATYFFRQRRIVVMTSQSFDGEYIARFIRRFGFGAVRGSSTRGGIGALAELVRLARARCPAGFMIDGPKGPRHEAKMGAVLLAKKTGQAVLPFSVNAESFWRLPSWDRLQIPRPFTRAVVRIAPPIRVAADADDSALAAMRDELQRALEGLSG